MLKAVIFDLGHTVMDELQYREVPLRSRPAALMPGVENVLPRIAAKMGIWANTRRAKEAGVRRWLARAGVSHYFTWVVTSVQAGHRKPDPRFFAYALRRCSLEKDEILFVGNQLNTDVEGAFRFGIASVWISGARFRSPDDAGTATGVKPTYTIAGPEELPGLVRKLQRQSAH